MIHGGIDGKVIAAVVGLSAAVTNVAGHIKFSARVSVTNWLGTRLFADYVSSSAKLSIAAPATAVTFRTATAVYFVPSPDLFVRLRSFLSRLWNSFGSMLLGA